MLSSTAAAPYRCIRSARNAKSSGVAANRLPITGAGPFTASAISSSNASMPGPGRPIALM